MTAKVENYCAHKRTRQVSIETSERACINCIWFEQHYRPNRGNVWGYVPISKGTCLLTGKTRGALRQPCHRFEKEGSPSRSKRPGHDLRGGQKQNDRQS